MLKNKSIKINSFWKFFCAYGVILLSLIVLALVLLYGLLKDYEKSMPNNTMKAIVSQFTDDNIDDLLASNEITVNEFESVDVIAEYIKTEIDDDKITFKRKNGEFTNTTPVYVVMAGNKIIAKVTLEEKGKNAHGFTEWQLGILSFDGYIDDNNEITITVPTSSILMINGVIVSEEYVEQSNYTFDPVKNVGAFVTAPTQTKYKISGLIALPTVMVTLNEVELPVSIDGQDYKAGYPADDVLLESQRSTINQINEAYGKYIINKGSLKTLQSYLVGNARTYVSDIPAVWAFLYQKEYIYEFRNQNITNFVKYSDDCFSCEIYYDLYVQWSNGNTTYNTSMIYTFAKINGKWKLADFTIN